MNCPVSIERVGSESVGARSDPAAPATSEFWLISRGEDRIVAVEFGSDANDSDSSLPAAVVSNDTGDGDAKRH